MQSFGMNLRYPIATILFSFVLGASTFSYKDAKNWGKHYPECKGKFQSPTAMDEIIRDGDYPSIKKIMKLTDLHELPKNMTIKNTGHTVEIKADWSGKPPRLTGGPLHGNYVFEKIIFRWAQKKWAESMNLMVDVQDTGPYDMEMQLYFYKGDLKSFEKAQSQKDGLAIIKVWLQVSDDSERPDFKPEPSFEDLEHIIHEVRSINSTAILKPFPLGSFIGQDFQGAFLFCKGSLDYPPCTESVTWFEPGTVMAISKNLLNGFRKITLDGGDVSNVRPLQPLNKRPVKIVFTQ